MVIEKFINIIMLISIIQNIIRMANLTLSIPPEMKTLIDSRPEIKWSEVFRQIIFKKLKQLEKFEELVKKGKIK